MFLGGFCGAFHLEHGAFFLLCHVCVELHNPGLRALLAPDGLAKRDLARNQAVRESLEENEREREIANSYTHQAVYICSPPTTT